MIDKLKVECSSCQKQLKLGELGKLEHLDSCWKVPCPLDCGAILSSIEDGQNHWTHICVNAFEGCVFCGNNVQRALMMEHHKTCPDIIISCSIKECQSTFKRSEE